MYAANKYRKPVYVLQIAVSALALMYVGYKIAVFGNWNSFFVRIHSNSSCTFILFIIVQVCLSAINISVETLRWKHLTAVIHPFRFGESLRQVLWGVRMGMVTPARVGEPVGKALILDKGNRTDGLVLSLAGSMLQNSIIGIAGIVALTVLQRSPLLNSNSIDLITDSMVHYMPVITAVIIITVAVCSLLIVVLNRNSRRWQQIKLHLHTVRKLGIKRINILICLTVMRYLLFSFQLWLAMRFFGADAGGNTAWFIPVYYLTVTFIPSFALLDIGIRGSAAIFIFGCASTDTAAIVTAAFAIWILNQALPALVGTMFIRPQKKWRVKNE